MSNKIRNIVVTSVFIAFMVFFVVMCGYKFANPTETSLAERRPLAQFPDNITVEGIIEADLRAREYVRAAADK